MDSTRRRPELTILGEGVDQRDAVGIVERPRGVEKGENDDAEESAMEEVSRPTEVSRQSTNRHLKFGSERAFSLMTLAKQ